MNAMRNLLAIASLTLLSIGAAQAQAPVSFIWAPPTDVQTVTVGTNITVALWAMPNPDPVLNISGFEAVIAWDVTKLDYLSYSPVAQPTALNTFVEGIGNGDLSVFDSTPSLSVPAGGTHIGDLTFATIGEGTSFISMLATAEIQTPAGPFGAQTMVYRLTAHGGDFVPIHTSQASITANPVPEPATVACLLIGASLLLRKRVTRK